MKEKDIDYLLEQIRDIILNKPLDREIQSETEGFSDLQEAIFYLSSCLLEGNEFLRRLSIGELGVKPPSRHNFLASSLKELHADLKHLTWQANQVAKGDYEQQINFLGDFSTAFNQMVDQLREREKALKQKNDQLIESVSLMKAIMDGLKDWIVVTDRESGEIIYVNEAAQQLFFDIDTHQHICGGECSLMEHLQYCNHEGDKAQTFEFSCTLSEKTLSVASYLIHWNDTPAYVHYVTDITDQKLMQKEMEGLAYVDELTGLYNRRYCRQQLTRLLRQNDDFCFCMIDLDNLKYANDHFGHQSGDDYIIKVTQTIKTFLRGSDCFCRIGGDEFAVMMVECQPEIILDKLKEVDRLLHGEVTQYPMSISYGVVHILKGTRILPETVMIQADEKMYMQKSIKKKRMTQ